MPSCEKYPQASASNITDNSTAITSVGGQSLESFITSIVTTQFAFLELMSQCALAWVNVPAGLTAAKSPQDGIEPQQVFWGNAAADYNHQAAKTLEDVSLQVQMITGVEEALNDEFFKPRPRRTQQRDILTLWERRNEFEATHVPANTHASEMHPESA